MSKIKLPLELHLQAMRIANAHQDGYFASLFQQDLKLCWEWLNSGKPTLGELHLITRLLGKWDQRTPDELSEEELEGWHKIREITTRMIDKGQYTTEETQ